MHHMNTPNHETIRVTVPVRPEVLEAFKRLAAAGNTSTGKAMGEWLADTLEGVEFMAMKMEEARAAPAKVMREMHAYALGLADETGALIQRVRQEGLDARKKAVQTDAARASARGSAPAGKPSSRGATPPSNTGVTNLKKKHGRG
jgi:hypothetical protein